MSKTKIKEIKKIIKNKHLWHDYKKTFKISFFHLFLSQIALVFKKNIDSEKLANKEINFIGNLDKGQFIKKFKELIALTKFESDWKSLANFLWLQFQGLTYNYDLKRGQENIFSLDNYIKLNALKRDYWLKWINSLDSSDPKFNLYIMGVLKICS